MEVSTPASLDLACPQAKAKIKKYVHVFGDRGVDKIKYGHAGIMIILKTATYIATCDMDLYYAVCRFYFFHITRSYKAYFLPLINHTYSKSNFYCLHR